MIPQLTGLAVHVHRLLLQRNNMATSRRLAEACLADPGQGCVDDLQIPDGDCPIYDRGRRDRQRAISGPPSLSQGQIALAVAALHDVGCAHVEKVIESPPEAEVTWSTLPAERSDEWNANYARGVRWFAIREKVDGLREYAYPWFEAVIASFERLLEQQHLNDDPPAGRSWQALIPVIIGLLRRHGRIDYLPECLIRDIETPAPNGLFQRDRLSAEASLLHSMEPWLARLADEPPAYLPEDVQENLHQLVAAAIEAVRARRPQIAVSLADIDNRERREAASQQASAVSTIAESPDAGPGVGEDRSREVATEADDPPTVVIAQVAPAPTDTQSIAPTASSFESLLPVLDLVTDSNTATIFQIGRDRSKTADERMSAIFAIDSRFLGWDSPQWASLLDVSPPAVRKTRWWRIERPRLRGTD